jgi:hypothetical protein
MVRTPIIIRLALAVAAGMTVAGSTGWFPHLPLARSDGVVALVIIATAVLLLEFGAIASEIAQILRIWWRGMRPPSD